MLNSLLQDLRFAARGLRRTPAFTVTAIATLALGIGANTALFSIVNGVLLSPLPFPQSDRLMYVYSTHGGSEGGTSFPNFLDWQRMNHSFAGLAAYRGDDFNLTGNGQPERIRGGMMTAGFFEMLGVRPLLGRTFSGSDDHPGAAPVAILSEELWKRNFDSNSDILGRTVTLSGTLYTIVGVAPAQLRVRGSGTPFDLYVPIGQWTDSTFRNRNVGMGLNVVGRLKPTVGPAEARADMSAVAANLAAAYPEANKDTGTNLESWKTRMIGDSRDLLLVLTAAVGFVLLIACANVANLMLARATRRSREFAVRIALGAGRARIVRQLLTECLLLSMAGALLGWLLAALALRASTGGLAKVLPRSADVHLDGPVLLFTLAACLLSTVLFGLMPAWRAGSPQLVTTMKDGGWGTSGSRHRIQGLFVAVEVAIACLLLVGAGLMIRSLARLWSVDPGLNPHHVLDFGVTLPPGLGKDPDAVRRMLTDVDRKLEEIPGVEAVSINDGGVPFTGDESDLPFWRPDRPKPASQNQMDDALFYIVQPGYLAAMQIPLLRGRFFTEHDGPQSPPVTVIDQDFADRIYPHQNPLGQRLNLAILDTQPEIVGIVGHVKHFGLDESSGQGLLAQFYFPVNQIPDRFTPLLDRSAEVLVRTSGAPESVIPAVRRQMQSMDKDEVVYDAQPLDAIVADSLAVRRFSMIVLGVFAALALALAAIGIYGVISYLTAQRTQEFGIRMALGAGRGSILGLVVRQGGGMAALGVVVGLAAAAALTRLMKSLLFGVGVRDPITMVAVGTVVMVVAVLACGLPARRATRVDPTTALRYE